MDLSAATPRTVPGIERQCRWTHHDQRGLPQLWHRPREEYPHPKDDPYIRGGMDEKEMEEMRNIHLQVVVGHSTGV